MSEVTFSKVFLVNNLPITKPIAKNTKAIIRYKKNSVITILI